MTLTEAEDALVAAVAAARSPFDRTPAVEAALADLIRLREYARIGDPFQIAEGR